MTIKIITKFSSQAKCDNCECQFSFDGEDIEIDYPNIGKKEYYIFCPGCNEKAILSEEQVARLPRNIIARTC
jgi:hypothetical protein